MVISKEEDHILTAAAGNPMGDPPGLGASYYRVRAIDSILPESAAWHTELSARMHPVD